MQHYRTFLNSFLKATKRDVMRRFASLPGAIIDKDLLWVFVPGSLAPEDRILFVAHADTVYDGPPPNVSWNGNIATAGVASYSKALSKPFKYNATGLGADNRAGCAMIWTYRKSGHSLLLTDLEESGCIGASDAVKDISAQLEEHCFAIQIDRRGDRNYVTYDCDTPEFLDYIDTTLPAGWHQDIGSYSDIAEVCPGAGICGLNMAAGFLYEHTQSETFVLDAWFRTRQAIDCLLAGDYVRYPFVESAKPHGVTLWTSLWEGEEASSDDLDLTESHIDPIWKRWPTAYCKWCDEPANFQYSQGNFYVFWCKSCDKTDWLEDGSSALTFESLEFDDPSISVDDFEAANTLALKQIGV